MKLEIDSVGTDGKIIRIYFLNIDKEMSLLIPIREYKDWLSVHNYPPKKEPLREFAEAYLEGVINHDSTADLLLEQAHKALQHLYGNQKNIIFYVEKQQYLIMKGKNQYRLFQDGRALTHLEIIDIYTAVMLSFRILNTMPILN